jgi:hypothetical protein
MSTTATHRPLVHWLGIGFITLMLVACGGGGGDPAPAGTTPTPGPTPQSFKLFPARLGLAVDDDGLLIAQTAPGAIVWSSSDPAVATVDSSGRVKALAKGSTVISATSGSAVATSTLKVYTTTGASPDPSRDTLIAAALAAGRINAEQALSYRVFALYGDARLPAEFDGAPSELPDHLLLREVSGQLPTLTPAAQALLAPFLIPPIYAESWYAQQQSAAPTGAHRPGPAAADRKRAQADITTNCFITQFGPATRTTDHFKIWGYFGDGFVGGDDGQPTTETFTDFIASVIEEVYASETTLFQRLPLSDANEPCNGGDGKVDIYLAPIDMSGRSKAQAVPYPNRCEAVPSYLVLNPIAMTIGLGRATVAVPQAKAKREWKSVLAHEFLHVLQNAMDRQAACSDYKWFDEATAVWVMDHVDATGNFEDGGQGVLSPGHARRNARFFSNYLYNDHRVSIENAHPESNPELNGYGDYLFFQYLARTYQATTIKEMFDATVSRGSVEAMAAVVDTKPGGMKAIWPAFARTLWNDDVGHVLDDWSRLDAYDFGLAAIYSPSAEAAQIVASAKLKSLPIDQQGQPRANVKLLKNALVTDYYEVQPRSMLYEHLKFSDASVHSVYLFNPIAPLPDREFIKLQALKKIGGVWQAVEDWTAEPYKQFCLDKADERLEELLLIVSNSEVRPGAEQPLRIPKIAPMRLATSNVGCWQWQGSATSDITDSFFNLSSHASGNVTLAVTAALPGRLQFEPSAGIVQGSSTQTYAGCTTTLAGAPKTVLSGAGGHGTFDFNLDLDLGFSDLPGAEPPDRKLITLTGSSTLTTTTTMVCPQVSVTNTGDQSWDWLRVDDPSLYTVSADGQVIEGRFTSVFGTTTITSVWRFTAMRE